jgi:LacI family transcriptional regulator
MNSPLRIVAYLQLDLEFGRGVLRGVAQHFRQHPGVTVLKFLRPATYQREAILSLKPDGVIAHISSREDERVLLSLGVPVVNVSGVLRHPLLTTVTSDNLAVGRLAMGHFHGRGHRHFAFVGNREHAASRLRSQGFQDAARLLGVNIVPHYYLPHHESDSPYSERLRAGLVRWLRSLPSPVGIFCFTDRVAVDVAAACESAGLRVPDQVAILGTDNDSSRLDFAQVEVSSIQLNTARIGLLATETLHDRILNPDRPATEVVVEPLRINIRQSSNHFAVDDGSVTEALNYISAHLGNPIYVNEIARTVGVSRRSLEMRFRSTLGTSVYAQVQRVRFERVIELMADRAMNLDEIAYSTGFGGAAAFSTMFRRHYKEPPSTYRQRMLAEGG